MAGRPSPITQVVGYREGTGEPITVADRITNALRAGSYFEQAASAAGVTKETGYEWLRVAGRARIRARGQDVNSIELTDHERDCLAFSDSVAEAESSWEIGALAQLERLARGGIPVEKTVTKVDARGNVLETTTTVEETLPSAQVLEWRLERKIPERYGRRIEVTGRDGEPLLGTGERQEALVETFAAYLQGVEDERATAEQRKRAARSKRAAARRASSIEARSTVRSKPPPAIG